MCGIAGLISKDNPDERVYESFIKSAELMKHRGPDYNSHVRFKNALLIHYRLSIIDLDPRSHQPFYSKDGNYCCVYNGEIYNYNDIKKQLPLSWRTTSDTEVLIESFAAQGKNAITAWNGIFATAILDKHNSKLTLVRDRYGVKPLYIYEDDKVIAFASEAKVILNWLDKFKISYTGLSQYLWYGNTIDEGTMIEKLRKMAPASIIDIDLEKATITGTETFWKIPGTNATIKDENEIVRNIQVLLDKAIERQLISDVPLGVLLSGGVDSSGIVALASQHFSGRLDTYSVEYDYNPGGKSELPRAAEIARLYNTNHHELKIEAKNITDTFIDLVYQYDEPFGDSASIPLYQLAKACSHDKRVILQGDGGDEFFAGYRRYNRLDWLRFWQVATYLGKKFAPVKKWKERFKRGAFVYNQDDNGLRMAYNLTDDVPYKSPYNILLPGAFEKVYNANPFQPYIDMDRRFADETILQKMLYTDVSILLPHTYLEKVDKATMLCSIEARVPYLDNDLTDYILQVPSKYKVRRGTKKYLLKKVLKGKVPQEILHGKKRGFDVPAYIWLQKDLYDFAKQTFAESANTGLLDAENLINILDKHKSNETGYGYLLWKSLVLAQWLKIYKSKIEL
jgi:asparagine synthase (glutamine-hydrolysing)